MVHLVESIFRLTHLFLDGFIYLPVSICRNWQGFFFRAAFSRGINVKHFYSGVVQVQDPSGMDLLKLTCKQKENWTVEKVRRMFTVLSFNSNHNL